MSDADASGASTSTDAAVVAVERAMTADLSDGAAAAAVVAAARPGFVPRLGIVLGSGLGELADAIEQPLVLPYASLPGFPEPGVSGHAGQLVLGFLAGLPVACLQGRRHVYESGDATAMRAPIRAIRHLGADTLLLTNAAGSLRAEVGPGRLMLVSDHINLLGANPLTGANDDAVGPRFPSLRDAYDPALRAQLHEHARELGIDLAEGVYAAVAGPSFETPAEIRALRVLGADAVGMSTVPEVILARHCGLRVAALSAITNLAEGMGGEQLTHEHTLRNAELAARDMQALVTRVTERLR